MPNLSLDQLAALAANGAKDREIAATLGRPMTPDERAAVDRARLLARIKRKTRGPTSTADRVAKHQALHSLVDWRECEDPARRKRLEADPEAWLRWYLAATYRRPFETPHHAIIEGAVKASRTGGRFVVAAERGIGKSSLLWGLVLMFAITGEHPFPALLPWDEKAKKRAFRFWRSALCGNDRLGADYPEICAPFRHSKGVFQRLLSAVWKGGPNDGEMTGAGLAIGEGLIVLPDNRGCIGGATINGNPRGPNHPLPDGRVLRPTLILLDDVQDRQVARSPAQIEDTITIIDADVAAMNEAGTTLPILMSGTCIERDDVMAHYLESDNWDAARIPCVESWPDGWNDGEGPTAKLWQTWYGYYQDGKGATTFYRRNRAAMTTGMVLTAPSAFKKQKHIPDPFCGAMLAWHKLGPEAFASEKQQAPLKRGVTLYNLTARAICERTTDRQPGAVPEWVRLRVGATDINPSYGLTWTLLGFGPDQTSAVLGYGIHPMTIPSGATEAEQARAIYDALAAHGRTLAALPCRPETWFIDAGGAQFDIALRFALESGRLGCVQAIPATGRGARNYRPYGKGIIGKPREQCHMASDARGRKWVAWNADYWKEVAQKAWTGTAGAPGTCSLPAGHHRDFADQICREQLAAKAEMAGAMRWEWHTQPGRHDYGDCMAMCYMGAAWQGVGTSGAEPPRERPKARVVIYRPSERRP
jgi:hypothetical protein